MVGSIWSSMFQHTAARRRLSGSPALTEVTTVSTHSRPKAADLVKRGVTVIGAVSTHSRPKAAAYGVSCNGRTLMFQHTAARRRLAARQAFDVCVALFQHTAARRRLAGRKAKHSVCFSFNTQPPEGGCPHRLPTKLIFLVSTHSRPKAAGMRCCAESQYMVSTHSRPKAAES